MSNSPKESNNITESIEHTLGISQMYVYDDISFYDFDQYQETAYKWKLDFRLMSKNGFSASRKSLITDKVIINRSQFDGKIVQYGLCPTGFRTFVVPAGNCSDFYWLRRNICQNHIMAFPVNGTLDAVSYDNFQVYTISISTDYLEALIENLGYFNAGRILGNDEVIISVKESFLQSFHINSVRLFNHGAAAESVINTKKLYDILTLELPVVLLKEFEYNNAYHLPQKIRRRDKALDKAIDVIETFPSKLIKVDELCEIVGVSERTLEYAFLERYKVQPKTFIKANALNKIKKELLRCDGSKISDIALKYGFGHMGQFAADFKNHFGVLPSLLNK